MRRAAPITDKRVLAQVVRTETVAYFVRAHAVEDEWNITTDELAKRTGYTVNAVAGACRAKGWMQRLRPSEREIKENMLDRGNPRANPDPQDLRPFQKAGVHDE